MSRTKIIVICNLCGKKFYRWCGQVNARFCSRKCSCKSKHTFKFQSRAGKKGAEHNIKRRGTGRKDTYVKYYGRHEHRVVAEKMLGRKLRKGEIVHHIDENKHNNTSSNLKVLSRREHCKEHNFGHK